MRTLHELLDHTLHDDLPELGATGIEALLREVELDALDLLVGPTGLTTAADLLDDVAGLPAARRAHLLDAFPTVAALVAATPDDLTSVHGVGAATAARVHATVRATVRAA